LKHFKDALKDFEKFNSLTNTQSAGFVGLGDAYKGLKQVKEALACYNLALEKKDSLYITILERRAILHFNNADYSDAMKDFTVLVKNSSSLALVRSYYYIGKIHSKIGKTSDAILHFE
jgi:tetratricopeptide (TPR) repeat protein